MRSSPPPVVLFAYTRPDHLRRTLDCLRADAVPLIYAFADGPRDAAQRVAVAAVRAVLRAVGWCTVVLTERQEHLGLGRSILTGVTDVLSRHDSVVVYEDDLVTVPGTYRYLATALERYRDDARVMSVTGWTHARVTPRSVTDQPYFDGRAECWVWGTWGRAWRGMTRDARSLMTECKARGIDVNRYGFDLPVMARRELRQNIWAVRWLYWHILNRGLCLRPPRSLVEHAGSGVLATNAKDESEWTNRPLVPCPPEPWRWPDPAEHPECSALWRSAYGPAPRWPGRLLRRIGRLTSVGSSV